ncbi:serine protease inhibitor swm-1-like [Calliopsis andreniformis]|uniref:serine protease inhibitor swm-1-like n=1 Tax=Calliopsis andreniformis TaxID=337506 RepID=UPI003FCDFD06
MSPKVIILFALMAVIACTHTIEACGQNEVLKMCGSQCQPTCKNRNPICIEECMPEQCQCKRGFVREYEQGPCILLSKCPK